MKTLSAFSATLLAILLAACASLASAQAPAKASGGVLTTADGMTLYTFDRDAAGKSACNGPCTANWPPLLAAASDQAAGDYGLIAREDGKQQWTYKDKPLYHWSKDQKPGDKGGDGFNNNLWHAAKP